MSADKKKKNNKDDDLKFTPLNIMKPLSNTNYPNNFSDGISFNSSSNNIFIGCPSSAMNPINNLSTMDINANPMQNINTPLSPYPANIPTITDNSFPSYLNNNSNFQNQNTNNTDLEDEYPSEDSANELYSYNVDSNGNMSMNPNNITSNNTNTANNFNNANNYTPPNSVINFDNVNNPNNFNNTNNTNPSSMGGIITPMDIVRETDLSLDEDFSRKNYSNDDIDAIFNSIQENNPSIFSALKAYRVPYPIATLLIKKVIQSTLEYKETGGR